MVENAFSWRKTIAKLQNCVGDVKKVLLLGFLRILEFINGMGGEYAGYPNRKGLYGGPRREQQEGSGRRVRCSKKSEVKYHRHFQ